jgi:hypothetical protein
MLMTDVDRLLRDYIERFEAGGSVDPSDLMAGLEAGERQKLSTLIEGYLEHAARPQEWNPEGFEGSVADRAVQRVEEAWSAEAGELPGALVRLRNERKIKREDLVGRLADALGVSAARDKVAFYYNRLEHGLLPTDGVSAKVWDALAGLLGTSSDSLREAGATATSADQASGAAYARLSTVDADELAGQAPLQAASPGRKPDEPDEVDRLFTGG